MKRARLLIAVCIACLVTACSQGDTVTSPAAAPGAETGGNLVLTITPPRAVDPALVSVFDRSASLVVRTMCDPIIALDAVTGEMRPALAERWEVGDSGKRITVKLRKGLKFNDGSSFDARDVAYSLTRVAARDTGSPVADLLQPIAGYEDVHVRPDEVEASKREQLAGIRVIETLSFEILLADKENRADFVRVLTHPIAMPVSRTLGKKNPDVLTRQPRCVGPYRMSKPFVAGQPIELVRSIAYHAKNAAHTRGGAGWADRIEFRIAPDRMAEAEQFRRGGIDIAHVAGPGPDVVDTATPTLDYIGLPTTTAPFDKPAVRVAMSQALDRKAIIDAVHGGGRQPARGYLPPALGRGFHRPDGACGANAPKAADVEGARASLAKAGLDLRGQKVRLHFNDEFERRRVMEVVGQQWKDAFGIEPELVPVMPWQQYLEKGRQPGFDGPFIGGWESQATTADGYIAPLFAGTSVGGDNLSRYADPRFDRWLVYGARWEDDPKDRELDYRGLEDVVCRQMPIIPISWSALHLAANAERVGAALGQLQSVTTGDVSPRDVWVKG